MPNLSSYSSRPSPITIEASRRPPLAESNLGADLKIYKIIISITEKEYLSVQVKPNADHQNSDVHFKQKPRFRKIKRLNSKICFPCQMRNQTAILLC